MHIDIEYIDEQNKRKDRQAEARERERREREMDNKWAINFFYNGCPSISRIVI